MLRAEVGRADFRVLLDLRGWALGEQGAELHHHQVVADLHHQVHVVFHQQDAHAFALQLAQHAGQGLLLLVAQAGNLAMGPQRLMEIARALATDPALLLLDEPAAGLRHHEKQALAGVLRQLKAEGMSLLLVEHDMDFVMGLADRVVVMEFGTKLMEGTPAEVQASPEVRAAYLGTEH
jgi:ABC-type branched-subunit amino acid transport system ATPase component